MSKRNGKDNREDEGKEKLTEQIELLTIHGWPRAVTSKSNFTRLAWSALCFTATGLLMYFTINSVKKHLKYEVMVNTNRKENDVIKFPAMTFCNTNYFSFTAYQNTSAPVYERFPENCSMDEAKYFKNEVNLEFFKLGCKMFFGNKKIFTSQVAVDCGYKFKFPKHFSLLPHAYPCFTLNNDSEFIQALRSSREGLHILIDFDGNDRRRDAGDEVSDSVLEDPRNGLYVAIHSPDEFHGGNVIYLSPGFETRIAIRKSIVKRKKSPFPSKCLDDDEQQFENIFPGRPSIDSCYSSCFFLNMYKKCFHVPPYMKPFMPTEKFPDQLDYPLWSYEKLCGHDLLSNCKCSLPCYKEYYKSNVMQTVWPQEWHSQTFQELLRVDSMNDMNGSISIIDIRKRLVKVVIYYSDLAEYSYEEKELYDIAAILSDFGGQMGLFVGASVISMVEIASFLWFCMKNTFKTNQRVSLDT